MATEDHSTHRSKRAVSLPQWSHHYYVGIFKINKKLRLYTSSLESIGRRAGFNHRNDITHGGWNPIKCVAADQWALCQSRRRKRDCLTRLISSLVFFHQRHIDSLLLCVNKVHCVCIETGYNRNLIVINPYWILFKTHTFFKSDWHTHIHRADIRDVYRWNDRCCCCVIESHPIDSSSFYFLSISLETIKKKRYIITRSQI